MEENVFWLRIWQTVALAVVVVMIAGVTSCQMTRGKLVRGVEAGASPMEMACALEAQVNSGRIATCHDINKGVRNE